MDNQCLLRLKTAYKILFIEDKLALLSVQKTKMSAFGTSIESI